MYYQSLVNSFPADVALTFQSVDEIRMCDPMCNLIIQIVLLFVMLYKVVLTFDSEDEVLKYDIQMKAIEVYFPVVLFIMLYNVVLSFESVNKILRRNPDQCDPMRDLIIQICGTVYYALQGGSNL